MALVPDFVKVPGRDDLVRAYCAGCEHYSRPVKVPTPADVRRVRERVMLDALERIAYGTLDAAAMRDLARRSRIVPVYPDTPRGWENGCPRCR